MYPSNTYILFLLVFLIAGCSSKKEAPDGTAASASASPLVAVPPVVDAAPPPSPEPPEPPKIAKKHLRVLHTGDSMVGGGLSRALGPKFVADGAKYFRDVIESGTIHDFSQNDHLPKLLASTKPDLIVISLGANHVPHFIDIEKEIGPYVPKLIKRVEKIDCIWVAPPIWKPHQQKFNDWLKDHVAPCKFYDATSEERHLEIARREDKIHPNEKGGEVWADDFWKFYKEGEGQFFLLPDAGAAAP
ncbi:MAG: SGNH/GDSL hydrolase family protein [Labilithrix sp.]|nr:SGNH/GDSL hydrolase family protein [Labilithrix sp.]MCW5813259.1 SGNH/GDSL hydrolase family protein [Labilithrix sp.]